jgi:hypothetical protein
MSTAVGLSVLDALVAFLDGPDRIQEEPEQLPVGDVRLSCICG